MNPFPPAAVPLHQVAPLSTVQGTLALDLQPRTAPPAMLNPPDASAEDSGPDLRWRRTLEQWAHRFGQAAVEIVGGDRPVSQLLRWTSREVYEDLARRALLVGGAGGHIPGQRRVQPVRPQVLSVHTCFLSRTAAETSLHLRYGDRSRALAARFEWHDEHWVCTALQFA